MIGLQGYGLFHRLIKNGHTLADMGLHGTPGDVVRLSYRLRIVKAFRGITLEGIEARTSKGYDALMLVFLTHSALERYLPIIGLKTVDNIEPALDATHSAKVVAEIFDYDKDGKFFNFLHPRLNKRLKTKLSECRDGKCGNVGVVSESIRHIFAHGHLAPNANDMKPELVCRICQKVSAFVLEFMDREFNNRMLEYARGKKV